MMVMEEEDEDKLTSWSCRKLEAGKKEKVTVFARDKLALKEAGASESEFDAELANNQTTQIWQLLNLELPPIETVALLALPSSESYTLAGA